MSLTTDASGYPVFQARYSAFGGTRAAAVGTPVADDEAVAYTSQMADRADGWIYFYGARIYDNNINRFISADTVVPSAGNPQGLNRYAYVLNSPLNHRDPSGHCLEDVCIGEIIIAAAVIEEATPIVQEELPVIEADAAQVASAAEQFVQTEGPQIEAKTDEVLQSTTQAGQGLANDVGNGLNALSNTIKRLPPNPFGQGEDPTHVAKIDDLTTMARAEFEDQPGVTFRFGRSIKDVVGPLDVPWDRRPDVSVIDPTGKFVLRVYEAARVDQSGNFVARELRKMFEYTELGIPSYFAVVK